MGKSKLKRVKRDEMHLSCAAVQTLPGRVTTYVKRHIGRLSPPER